MQEWEVRSDIADYPDRLLEDMLVDLQDAERFDRFGLYMLNPHGRVPKSIGTFCVPVTMSQIPRGVRQALWGADPTRQGKLPSRYEKFSEVFDHLWENEQELRASVEEARGTLLAQPRSGEQVFSRIIENVEEIAGLEIDREVQRVNFVILSNMLQNSPAYSHYRNSWDFDDYLTRRSGDLPAMRRFRFQVYLMQSCQSLTTDRRRALQRFWKDYFEQSDAAVSFRLLGIDGEACEPERATTAAKAPAPPPRSMVETERAKSKVAWTEEELEADVGGADGTPIERGTRSVLAPGPLPKTAVSGGDGADVLSAPRQCPKPTVRSLPGLRYPRNARGAATLRYKIELNNRGVPVRLDLYDMEIDVVRHEPKLQRAADAYIRKLRFDVSVDDSCLGGLTTSFALRYDE